MIIYDCLLLHCDRRYTCLTLGTILMFEASTVFQRLKSMATLRGMSTKSCLPPWESRCGVAGGAHIEFEKGELQSALIMLTCL